MKGLKKGTITGIVMVMLVTLLSGIAPITVLAEASIQVSSSALPASNAIDGNTNTFWASGATINEYQAEWIYMDLAAVREVTGVKLTPRIAGSTVYCFPKDFAIQYSSDAVNWTDVPGQTYAGYAASNSQQVFAFADPVDARFIRIHATRLSLDDGSNYYFQLAEFKVDVNDTDPPALQGLSPSNGETEAAVNTLLTLSFNEPVRKGTAGNITIKQSGDLVVASMPVTDSRVTVTGNQVTVALPEYLAYSAAYYVEVDAGAIQDEAGNGFAGIAGSSAWAFTTEAIEAVPPAVSEFVPAAGASHVPINANLELTFNEEVRKGTAGAINIRNEDGSLAQSIPVASSNVLVSSRKVTIKLLDNLKYDTPYYVEIDSGGIMDIAGNPYAGIAGSGTWAFTTVKNYMKLPIQDAVASSIAIPQLPAGNAIDGTDQFWASTAHADEAAVEWIYIGFENEQEVSRIKLLPRSYNGNIYSFPKDFKLQSSLDAANWTDVPGQSFTGYVAGMNEQVFTFDTPVNAKYIRVYATKLTQADGPGYYFQVAEIQAESITIAGDAGLIPPPSEEAGTHASDLYDNTGIKYASSLLKDSNSAAERFTAKGSFSAIDVFAFNWQKQTGSVTLELYAWDTDYATTLSGTAIASQNFTDYPNNSALKLAVPAAQAGEYLWVLKNPGGKVGVWSTTNSTHPNTAYMNGNAVTGDYASRIYYTDAANAEMSGYPFASDAPNNFSTYLNRMWSIYGAVNDGTNAVYKFGNEPTYFDWIATKLMWSNEAAYKQELRNKVRDFAIGSDGYVWSWADQERWPSGDSLHYGNNVNYIIAVYKILSWENSTDFLNEVDGTTSAAGDASSGLTVRQKVDMAMNYILNELNGSNGLLIIDNGENTGKADGHASNYWDNLKYGYKEGYSNIYFYQALLAMSGIETMTGHSGKAAKFAALAKTAKANYDATFWDASKGRYVATIDEDGKAWDFGFTFQNMEALANGLGDSSKATRIYDWLDGRRIIDGDTSTGTDIYNAFNYAPRANTVPIESTGSPYWWNDVGGGIPVTTSGGWNEHLENGGTIFYISFYDLVARAKYLGADNAKARFDAIMSEFRIDELRRDRKNSYGAAWLEGIIGEFPESGLVPASYLYAFMGIDAAGDSMRIYPNLPSDTTHSVVKDIVYGGVKYDITEKKVSGSYQVEIATHNGGTAKPKFIVGSLRPKAVYTLTNQDRTNGRIVSADVVTNDKGEVILHQNMEGSSKLTLVYKGVYTPPQPPIQISLPQPVPASSSSIHIADGEALAEVKADDSGAAEVDFKVEDLNKAMEDAQGKKLLVGVKVIGEAAKVKVRIPVQSIITAAGKNIDTLEVNTGLARISIHPALLKEHLGAGAAYLEFTVSEADTGAFSEETRNLAGSSVLYDFNLSVDGKAISPFGGKVSAAIPYTLNKGETADTLTVLLLAEDGAVRNMMGRYDSKTYEMVFTTGVFGKFMVKNIVVTFADLEHGYWAEGYIASMAAKGIIEGTGANTFNPTGTLRRAEFVRMLAVAAGIMDDEATVDFSDVSADEWFYNYVASAYKAGIITGKPEGTFDPNGKITRQEMAVMLVRALGEKSPPVSGQSQKPAFKDQERIAGWAREDVARAVEGGYMTGKPGNVMDPEGDASRAEGAAVIYRFYN